MKKRIILTAHEKELAKTSSLQAIKSMRQRTGEGLKVCKDSLEAWVREHPGVVLSWVKAREES